jgi:broad specificity phosphatase PhoE
MGNIYLLRHGETDWNRERRLQGNLDVYLNKAGIGQARALAHRLEHLPIRAVLTSPLARARQTAAIISARRNWPVAVIDDLREIDHGVWTGRRLKTIERRHPGPFAVWQLEPDRLILEGGERLRDAYCRATRFLSGLLKSALDGDVLVVGHGVTNSLVLCAAAGAAAGRIWECAQPNASIAVLRVQRRAIVSIEGLKDEAIN